MHHHGTPRYTTILQIVANRRNTVAKNHECVNRPLVSFSQALFSLSRLSFPVRPGLVNRDESWKTGKNRVNRGKPGSLHGCIKMFNTTGANRDICQKPGKKRG